ncbi:MAG TPA: primosomal protein N' [Patescibacteria group bacterium]|jgi:primosomal protein N' (replication factor Y)|nr:primosomal protein N' [Patescibacteria group bacterium]
MRYVYEVIVASQYYHGSHLLSYSGKKALPVGQIVVVPLRNQQVLGIVQARSETSETKNIKPVSRVLALPAISSQSINLLLWLSNYYPSSLGLVARQFLPANIINDIGDKPSFKSSHPKLKSLPKPTTEQQQVLEHLTQPGTYILRGETGSGKTRVYQELVYRAYRANKSSIVLTPEIGLTAQLYSSFKSVFGDNVILFHSHLSPPQRRANWLKIIFAKSPVVVIGPRSALFSPLKNIGVIIIDESHENAYKQEQAPRYQTVRVAAKLGQLHNAMVVLGSATPDIVDYYVAEQKSNSILEMTQLAAQPNKVFSVKVEIVDLKDKQSFSKSRFLSDQLISSLKTTLMKHEQSLIFLNRRGTSRVVICDSCGWQALCPNCDLPLVYHGDLHLLRCHICSFKQPALTNCPLCHNTNIILRSIGTKAVVDELTKLFPQATIARFDGDNKKIERLEENYEAVLRGDIDIIVGTQTLGKGLDLPKLSLVGMVLADSSLYIPDYKAQEKFYQIITQVVGRIGRGHRDSEAIIQTYSPQSPILLAALNRDWLSFYHNELDQRQTYNFPPFCYIVKLRNHRTSQKAAETAADVLFRDLSRSFTGVNISHPSPAFHEKNGKFYDWQIVIKSKQRQVLLDIINQLPAGWIHDIDPNNLL